MSPPGRPKGEYRSAQHEGSPLSPPGRPKGEYRSAQHEGSPARLGTAWEAGRLDAGRGPPRVLFGRMYEDPAIERAAFAPGGRVFCIASAGCTAMHLAPHHEVVAVDINAAQLAYATQRIAGAPMVRGTAEHVMRLGRALLPLAGWKPSMLRAFLDLDDPATQHQFWKAHLDTRRFRAALDALMSVTALRAVYAPPLLASLPDRFGAVMRARMERCFRTHPNRANPWARALLVGEVSNEPPPPEAKAIALVHSDAATYLEQAPPASFSGFTLSNILDGAEDAYRHRLFRAVSRAAAPEAQVVLRSFGEPVGEMRSNRAADDRSILWGIVDVRPAATLLAA
jgi:S-adenosylmethionine:diacylglycerol 3-amino-3-carboxypropyl transferase